MAFGAGQHIIHNPTTGVGEASISAARTRSNSAFVRELWTDEFLAAYKSNLVMPQLVRNMPFTGKKGDTVHVPVFANTERFDGSAKAAETQIVFVQPQASQKQYLIDTHWHYAVMIEDLVKVQAEDSIRQYYTNDAGYALAKKVDTDLHAEGAKLAGADASPYVEGSAYSKAVVGTPSAGALVTWNPAANTNTGNGSTLTDEGVRLIMRELDDNDVPSAGRVWVLPPVEKKNLLGLDRYTEHSFVGEAGSANSIRNGLIGSLYGDEVYVSTNVASQLADDASTNYRAVLHFQREAFVFIEQMAPRMQTEYIIEYLGDAFVADTIYGKGVLRPEAGVAVMVPA